MNTPAKKSQFLLLLRQPPGGTPPPAELEKIMAKFQTWMTSLQADGRVLGCNGLDPITGKVLRGGEETSVTDGPYAEGKEIVGGYLLFTADDLDDAVRTAQSCPGLHHNMVLEVRPVLQRG